MFTGFTDNTQSFFWDLQFNNEREWFREHRESFEENLNRPFKELGKETFELVKAAFPTEELDLHLSRIYRDARRLFGRGPYKDNLWFSLENSGRTEGGPSFFFEISPAGWCCGLGFYSARASEMESFRKSVDANPERFRRLAEEAAALEGYIVEGPEYKKPKGDYGEAVNAWYNRKSVSIIRQRDYDDLLMSDRLPKFLAEDFSRLIPLYDYLNRFCTEYL